MATTTVDTRGAFSVDIGPKSGTVRVEVDLGTFAKTSEAAIVDGLELGEERTNVEITPVTHLASLYAAWLERRGGRQSTALATARRLFDEHFGGADQASTEPRDLATDSANTLDDGALISVLLGGLEEQALVYAEFGSPAGAEDVSVAGLLARYSEDISDGVFDGKSPGGPVVFAGHVLGSDSLRELYTKAIAHFLEGPRNPTPFRAKDLAPVLDRIRSNQSALFPVGPPPDERIALRTRLFGLDGGVIDGVRPIRGQALLEVEADSGSDPLARIEATASSSSAVTAVLAGPTQARFLLDTTRLPDGPNQVWIEALDAFGGRTSTTLALVVDNTPPSIAVSAPARSLTATVTVTVTSTDAFGPVDVALSIDGAEVRLHNPQPSLSIITAISCGHEVLIEATATDAAGNVSTPAFARTRCDAEGIAIHLGLSTFVDERDLLVDRLGDHLVYRVPATARTTTISDIRSPAGLLIAKYHTRFDAFSENLPVLRLVLTGSVSTLAYRYVVGGNERRAWTTLPVRDGEADLAISYQTLGVELALAAQGAVHGVEILAGDERGHEARRLVDFEVALLSPPLWVDGCRAAAPIAWSELGPRFLTGVDIAVGEGALSYLLDIDPASLTPRQGLRVDLPPLSMSSDIVELSEQKFSAPMFDPWMIGSGAPPPNVECAFDQGSLAFAALESWTQNEVCQAGLYSDEDVFYEADQQGRVSDPSPSAGRIDVVDARGVVVSASAGQGTTSSISVDVHYAFQTTITHPRLSINGATYDWTRAFDPVPMGYTSRVDTSDRYRLPGLSFTQTGEDFDLVDAPSGDVLFRGFVTRPSIHRFRITSPPPALAPAHLGNPGLAVPVRTATSCVVSTSLEVHE
jgi:hypothetical protein